MPSDQHVTAQMILQATLDLQRHGSQRTLGTLESLEPDLASYLMENLSLIHHKLLEVGASPKQTLRLQRRIESLALVCILALRKGHLELWEKSMGSQLAQLDPSHPEDPLAPGDSPGQRSE